jgi:hypothetical protein
MKKTWILIGGIVVLLVVAVIVLSSGNSNQQATDSHTASHTPVERPATATKVVPAYFETAPSRASLGPTLAPEKFTGMTRDAYRAVREIPVTIAQMPCYCHCDRGMGHKSLYSCYEDEHASHCAVCVNEALLASRLEKEGKSVSEIRDRIIAEFGSL